MKRDFLQPLSPSVDTEQSEQEVPFRANMAKKYPVHLKRPGYKSEHEVPFRDKMAKKYPAPAKRPGSQVWVIQEIENEEFDKNLQNSSKTGPVSVDQSIQEGPGVENNKKTFSKCIIGKTGVAKTHKFIAKTKKKEDWFMSVLKLSWTDTLLAFVAGLIISWLVFGGLWWLIALHHGDYDEANLVKMENGTFVPCILANKNLGCALLFSVETQQRIRFQSGALSLVHIYPVTSL